MRFLYTLSHPVFIIMVLFQLHLETVQDLLAPGRDNITLVEDPKTSDVSLPGVTMVQVLFQLYLETVQDLLAPGRVNIIVVEYPKTGDVSFPGVTMVQVHDRGIFVQLLEIGEVNHFASNTKMNTESSRSHAILLVIKCEGNYFMS